MHPGVAWINEIRPQCILCLTLSLFHWTYWLVRLLNVLTFSTPGVMWLSMRIITPLFLLFGGVRGKDNIDKCKLVSESESAKKALRLLEPLTQEK